VDVRVLFVIVHAVGKHQPEVRQTVRRSLIRVRPGVDVFLPFSSALTLQASRLRAFVLERHFRLV
jgi:hypothetical protein